MRNPRVAVVTGAASGMGRAAAVRLARAGTQVAAVDRAAEALKELAASQPGISAFECDVSDAGAVSRVAEEVQRRLGEVDRLVTAAAICLPGRMDELSSSDFGRIMEVNYLGTVHWVKAVLPAMRARRAGEIVLFASIAGWMPTPSLPAYCASKFAVVCFTECLAEETAGDGLRILCVCPPGVDTPMLSVMLQSGAIPRRATKLVKPLSADAVIDAIEEALPQKRLFLFPGPGTTTMWRLRRFAPGLLRRLFQVLYGV
jgi:NAD(P)-dependent dehydrogenase (short-subunit alcohol dehydrogenase family)